MASTSGGAMSGRTTPASPETLASRFNVRPASPLIGAEIEGVDLTLPVDEATAEALREAFWTYKVLVFRGQNLSRSSTWRQCGSGTSAAPGGTRHSTSNR
jgi:alpha-ketoglutarate-dependent taurine dioxygenase